MFLDLISVIELMLYCPLLDKKLSRNRIVTVWYLASLSGHFS